MKKTILLFLSIFGLLAIPAFAADVKMSQLPVATTLSATDICPANSSGVTSKLTIPVFIKQGFATVTDGLLMTPSFTPTDAGEQSPLWIDTTYSGTVGEGQTVMQAYGPLFRTIIVDGSTGIVHGFTNVVVRGTGTGADNETTPIFLALITNSGGNVWGSDHHVYGPHSVQTPMMVGYSIRLNNYNSAALAKKSVGYSVQTTPGPGGPTYQSKDTMRSYSNDIGVLVGGWAADANGSTNKAPGFKTGFQAGGTGIGPWAPTISWLNTAFLGRDFDTYGIYLQAPYSGSTPYAIVTEDTTGNTGLGTITPAQKLEVNGGVRLNTSKAKPTCDAAARGTFWVTLGGAGVADTLEICLKGTADTYSWKAITSG